MRIAHHPRPALRALTLAALAGLALAAPASAAKKPKPKPPIAFKGEVSGVAIGSGSEQTWSGKVRFERKRKRLYVTESGLITWQFTGTTSKGCRGQLGPIDFPLGREQAAILFLGKPKGKRAGKRYVINPELSYLGDESDPVTYSCPNGDTVEIETYRAPWIGTDGYPFTPRSGVLGGSFTDSGEGSFAANPLRWEFRLRPVFRRR